MAVALILLVTGIMFCLATDLIVLRWIVMSNLSTAVMVENVAIAVSNVSV